jgi:ketosteroid isomerase-like protein
LFCSNLAHRPGHRTRIRDAYQAFVTGDFDALNAFFHPDAEYVNPSYAVESGTRQGTTQLTQVWHSLHEMFEFSELHIDETAAP